MIHFEIGKEFEMVGHPTEVLSDIVFVAREFKKVLIEHGFSEKDAKKFIESGFKLVFEREDEIQA